MYMYNLITQVEEKMGFAKLQMVVVVMMAAVVVVVVHCGNDGADHRDNTEDDVKQVETLGALFPGGGNTGPGLGIVIQPGTGGARTLPPFTVGPPGGAGTGSGVLPGRTSGPGLGRFRHRYHGGNGPRFHGGVGPGRHDTGPGSGYGVGGPGGGYDYNPDYGSPGGSDYEPEPGSPDPDYGGPGDGFNGGDDPGFNGGGFGPGYGGIGSSHGRGGFVPFPP